MKKYGLIGWPLGHSFSAGFFAEKFAKEGIDARYDNYEMETVEGLRAFVKSEPNLCGLNVTIPHKQAVIPLLDEISEEAAAIGAVNVIRVRDGKLKGFNSDIIGFMESIRPLLKPHHTSALVLGTGGASKAIVVGLRKLGIEPTYVSRSKKPGQLTYEELTPEIMAAHTVIVNCSPVGMFPKVENAPAIPYDLVTPQHLLYDLVYNPLEPRFLTLGKERGATVKNGLEMLHLQAIASWEFWNK